MLTTCTTQLINKHNLEDVLSSQSLCTVIKNYTYQMKSDVHQWFRRQYYHKL